MNIEFANPRILLLFIPLILHVLWMSRRLNLLTRGRRVTAVFLRGVLLLLLLLSLAGLRVSRDSDELTVFFVMDESASLPEPQREYSRAYVRSRIQDLGPDDKAGIIVFGANPSVERGPGRDKDFERIDSVINADGTNIADAIQLATACFVGNTQKRIVLLSDGNQNAGDAESAARSAAGSDVVIDVVPLRYENRNDVILEKVTVENRVSLEEPFDLRIIASSRHSGPATLNILQDGGLIGSFDVDLRADEKNQFVIPTQVTDAGFHTFDVQIDVEGDRIPENNRGFAFTYGEGEPTVLFVDGDANPSPALPAMLRSENIDLVHVTPENLPHTLRELQNFDSVIFNNVGASDLTQDQMKLIETASHDLGIGFIMIGGEHSFGPGGYNDSPIERILPVDMELKNEKILPQGALVPVIHTVEIPEGQMWAEKVAEAALDVLSPRDLMGILYYSWTDQESWLFELQEVGDKNFMRQKIRSIQPGDMPSFDTTMQLAYDGLVNCTASVKHVVIISDGDPQTPNRRLAEKIRDAGISISTVIIAPHNPARDTEVMRDLAKWGGGNFYYPKQFNKLPQIFIKEAAVVRKALIFEESFKPEQKFSSALLPGVGPDYPMLRGYVGTMPKKLADVPLVTDKGDPLLAHWQHGVGKSVAFTSDAKERWATGWVDWEQFSKFWSQVVRWSLRPNYNQSYQVETIVDGAKGRIIIDAVDADGEFRNFLEIGGRVVSPSLEARDVEFRQLSPGRYEAEFDVLEAGNYWFSARSESEEENSTDLITGGASLSYSPEYQDASSNMAVLTRMSDITSGRVLDETMDVFLHNLGSHTQPSPLWPAMLLAAIIVLLMDVFTRRVIVNWRDMREMAAAGTARVTARFGWRTVRTGEESSAGRLLKAKERAHESAPAPPPQDREAFLESLKKVKIDRSPVAESRKPQRPAGSANPPATGGGTPGAAPPPGAPSTHTSKLLEARSKARRKFERSEDEGKDK